MAAETPRFTWDNISKFAVVCFVAGGIFMQLQNNEIKNEEQDLNLSQAIIKQTQTYALLSSSLYTLNIAIVRLEGALASRNDDIKEIKVVLTNHAFLLDKNHDELMILQQKHTTN